MEARAPRGPSGLSITPHLIGTCNPDFNPDARAAISGLFASAGRGHIYKGILEGIACELLQYLRRAWRKRLGPWAIYTPWAEARVRQLAWRFALRITGRRFHLMRCQEAVCLGGAILSAVALGTYRDIPEAIRHMVHEKEVIQPNPQLAAEYTEQIGKYRALLPALESVRKAGASFLLKGEPS